MRPRLIAMPDGTEYRLTRILSSANNAQQRGRGYRAVGVTLTPMATGGAGRNLCPHATKGCSRACFARHDRLAWWQNKRAAVARTQLLALEPDVFLEALIEELTRAAAAAGRRGQTVVCRLNVVSDFPYEREMPSLFTRLPHVQFMDYTKDASRVLSPDRPPNYHLTFSRSETNEADCRRVLEAGHNVSAVFRTPPFPETWWGYPVIDGDAHDFRFLDPSPRVVGLKAKGKGARDDRTGFVIDARIPLPTAE